MPKDTPINDNYRHELFCQQYVSGEYAGNGTRSYMAVYPDSSEESAAVGAARLIGNDKITARIAVLQEEQLARLQITGDYLLRLQKEAAEMDYADLYDDDGNLLSVPQMPEHVRRNIAEMTVTTDSSDEVLRVNKIKMTDRAKARELLMKHLAMLTERREVAVTGLEVAGDIIFKDDEANR